MNSIRRKANCILPYVLVTSGAASGTAAEATKATRRVKTQRILNCIVIDNEGSGCFVLGDNK